MGNVCGGFNKLLSVSYFSDFIDIAGDRQLIRNRSFRPGRRDASHELRVSLIDGLTTRNGYVGVDPLVIDGIIKKLTHSWGAAIAKPIFTQIVGSIFFGSPGYSERNEFKIHTSIQIFLDELEGISVLTEVTISLIGS